MAKRKRLVSYKAAGDSILSGGWGRNDHSSVDELIKASTDSQKTAFLPTSILAELRELRAVVATVPTTHGEQSSEK